MSDLTSALLAGAIVLVVVLHLAWQARASRSRASMALAVEQDRIRTIIADAANVSDGTAGVITWEGSWNSKRVQVRTIVD
ncbi:hypothetical protein ENZ76_27185, partial [Mesorhizobium sp. M7A.F.Ca.CA.002.10.1.1]